MTDALEPIESLLERHDGALTTSILRSAGHSKRRIQAAVSAKQLERVRPGGFIAPRTAPGDLGVAILAGGSLTAASAFAHHGLWTPHGERTRHLRLSKKRAELWEAGAVHRRFGRESDCLHVLPGPRRDLLDGPIDDAETAMIAAGACAAGDDLVAVLESFLRVGGSLDELLRLSPVPRGFAAARDRVVAGADSGLETLVRVRLEDLGLRVRAQVRCGVWPCDLVVGEWLVIELDGFAFHSSRAALDRDAAKGRDLALAGYTLLRFTYDDVMHRWPECLAQIEAAVRTGLHLRSRLA